MFEREVKVTAPDGLHVRPAAVFVKAASAQTAPATIAVADKPPAPANSLLAVMALGINCGQTVTLASESEAAVDALAVLLADPAATA